MKTDREEEQAPNPFLALFPNGNQAKQYVESTKTGLEKSHHYNSQLSVESSSSTGSTSSVKEKKSSKLMDLISISNKQFKKSVAERREIIINDFLQRVFLLTVNTGMYI